MNSYRPIFILGFFLSFTSCHAHDLADLQKACPSIRMDIRYASQKNFTGTVVYRNFTGRTYLLRHVTEALADVQRELELHGLGLLVWDAYRPLPAQGVLWELVKDPRYVAPPHKGGRHTRGTAVDCTLIDKRTNEPLEMPTAFDDFSEQAAADYHGATGSALRNRLLLRLIMEKHGFIPLLAEWWHFDYHDWQSHPPLEIDFNQLHSEN